MTTETLIEQRLTAAEKAISELQQQLANRPVVNWIGQITGSFKGEPAFEKVLEFGRAMRLAD